MTASKDLPLLSLYQKRKRPIFFPAIASSYDLHASKFSLSDCFITNMTRK